MTMTSILEVLPAQFRAALRGLDWDKIQELRLRSGYPLGIKRVGEREAAHNAAHDPAHDAAGVLRAEDVAAVLAAATRQSAYSAQETLREGYLMLEGGHRVGVCGTLVLRGGEPYSMKDVTSLNIRVAHDIRMDSARLLPYLRENLLIIGVPGSGKQRCCGPASGRSVRWDNVSAWRMNAGKSRRFRWGAGWTCCAAAESRPRWSGCCA